MNYAATPKQQPPPASGAPPATSSALVAAPASSRAMMLVDAGALASAVSGSVTPPAWDLMSTEIAATLVDLSHCMCNVQDTLSTLLSRHVSLPTPPNTQPLPPTLTALLPSAPRQSAPLQTTSYPYDMPIELGPSSTESPQSSTSIHHIKFPPSPSPIPSWAYGTTTMAAPVYSLASPRPMITPSLSGSTARGHGGPAANGTLYIVVDGLLSQEHSSLLPHASAAATVWSPYHAHNNDAGMEARAYEDVDARPSPSFYKLEFATYDGSEDPLNWLNHCEQFFRGQRTPLQTTSARLTHRRAGTPSLPVYGLGVLRPLPGIDVPSVRHLPSLEDRIVHGRPSRISSGGRRNASTTRPADSHVPSACVQAPRGSHATTSAT
jgi:hypothetical protein